MRARARRRSPVAAALLAGAGAVVLSAALGSATAGGAAPGGAALESGAPGGGAPAAGSGAPAVRELTLSNGLRVLLSSTPRESFRSRVLLVVGVGTQDEAAGEGDAARLTAEALLAGQGADGRPVERALALLGGEAEVTVAPTHTVFGFEVPHRRLGALLDLLAEVAGRPVVPPEAWIAGAERRALARRREGRDPGFQAAVALREALGGAGAPPPAGGARELEAFRRRHYRPDRMVLAVVAGGSSAGLEEAVRESFGRLAAVRVSGSGPPQAPPAVGARSGLRCVHLPGVEPPLLVLGLPLPPHDQAGFLGWQMLAHVLGDGHASRLHRRLRLEEELVYTVEAALRPGAGGRRLLRVAAQSAEPARVRAVILEELRRLAAEGPEAAELAAAQAVLRSRLLLDREDLAGRLLDRSLGLLGLAEPTDPVAAEQLLSATSRQFLAALARPALAGGEPATVVVAATLPPLCRERRREPEVAAAPRSENAGGVGGPALVAPPLGLPEPPVPADNALTPAKVELGRRLFFDRRLSSDGTVACASCHRPERAFADDRPLSLGVRGQEGDRNAPSLLNAAYVPKLFWDGRSPDLEDQVRYPLTHPKEMDMKRQEAEAVVRADATYPPAFARAFGDPEVTFERISQALASFQRILVSGDSPFDRFILLGQEQALSPAARRGWDLFRGKAGCIRCHRYDSGHPFFTDFDFHNTGVGWDREELPDLGRYRVTHDKADRGLLRTPSLRTAALAPPYMHDGSFATLAEVVAYYAQGGIPNRYLDERIMPLDLSAGEQGDLVAFLESLSGEVPPVPRPAGARPARPSRGPPWVSPHPVEVVAGSPDVGDGGPATEARLAGVSGIAVDARGNLYLSDSGHNRVRRVDAATGVVTTIAGTGAIAGPGPPGKGTQLALFTPGPLALEPGGRRLLVAEVAGHRVLALDLASGLLEDLGAPAMGFGQPVGLAWGRQGPLVVDTLAAQLWTPSKDGWQGLLPRPAELVAGVRSVAQDAAGNLFLSEFFGHRVVRWEQESGRLEPVAGSGRPGRPAEGAAARDSPLGTPDGIVLDGRGGLLLSDLGNQRISRVDLAGGGIRTVYQARPGQGLDWAPGALALDRSGRLWVADVRGDRVLRFDPGEDQPVVVAGGGGLGDGGPAREARLGHPGRVALDRRGNLYVSDALTHRVRRVAAASGRISTVAGTGIAGYNGDDVPAERAQLNYPGGLAVDGEGRLYIADYYNHRVRRVDPESGRITTVAGTGLPQGGAPAGPAGEVSLLNPHALSLDGRGGLLITSAVAQSVHRLDLAAGTLAPVALDPRAVPTYRTLVFYGVAATGDGFYLADGMRSTVLRAQGEKVRRVVSRPHLHYPMDVAVSPAGELFICDTRGDRVVRWTGSEVQEVISGLGRPRGITFDAAGDLYVADTFHNRVLRVSLGAASRQGADGAGDPAAPPAGETGSGDG